MTIMANLVLVGCCQPNLNVLQKHKIHYVTPSYVQNKFTKKLLTCPHVSLVQFLKHEILQFIPKYTKLVYTYP